MVAGGKHTRQVKRQLFPEKLWDLVNMPDSGVQWSTDGKNIEVQRCQLEKLIGSKFRSSNFDSFIRQLHFYGFRKCGDSYHHNRFQRGQPDAVLSMKRKYSSPLTQSVNNSSPTIVNTKFDQSNDSNLDHHQLNTTPTIITTTATSLSSPPSSIDNNATFNTSAASTKEDDIMDEDDDDNTIININTHNNNNHMVAQARGKKKCPSKSFKSVVDIVIICLNSVNGVLGVDRA